MYDTAEKVKGMLLENLWNLCYKAHSGTSFSPERRATSYVTDYSHELEEDLKELGENCGNYKEKYISKFSSWMSAKSNCISSMITGGSNFPVRKAEKANNAEHNHYTEFRTWREKYFNSVNRVKIPTPENEIEVVFKKLDNAIILNENIKEYNKVIRKYKKGSIDKNSLLNGLIALEISDKLLKTIDEEIKEMIYFSFDNIL